jgi:hypothetical protein
VRQIKRHSIVQRLSERREKLIAFDGFIPQFVRKMNRCRSLIRALDAQLRSLRFGFSPRRKEPSFASAANPTIHEVCARPVLKLNLVDSRPGFGFHV